MAASFKQIATARNAGLKLTQLELSLFYRGLRDEFDMKPDAIALHVRKSRQHVDQLLILADAPAIVRELVADGSVAATEAMKLTRTHGEKAGEVLQEQVNRAKAAGRHRVTAKTLKRWTPPTKIIERVAAALDRLVASISPLDHGILNVARTGQAQDAKVSVSAKELMLLADNYAALVESRRKAEEKAAKARCYVMQPAPLSS